MCKTFNPTILSENCMKKITITIEDDETITTYHATLDENNNVLNEYTDKVYTDELILSLLENIQ